MGEDNSAYWTENYHDRLTGTINVPDEGINRFVLVTGRQTSKSHLNREMRFYSNLFFDGGTWFLNGDPGDTQAQLRKPIYLRGAGIGYFGPEDYSITGYGTKKLLGYRSSTGTSGNSNAAPWRYAFPIIRLADVYLMYAEALNEWLDVPNQEVWDAIDEIRERSGLKGVVESWSSYSNIPTKPLNKEGMREIIRHERLNELSFEGKRFWDLRRWMIPPNNPIQGWNIRANNYNEFYRVTDIFERTRYSIRDYLWPIPVREIERNPNLVQNPGWE
jgi:hypothetical protein